MTSKMVFLFLCSMLFSPAYANTIYQWVDDNGRTQISDKVPPRYKGVATELDTSASRVSERQRQEALERVARQKTRVEAASRERAEADAENAAAQPAQPKSAVRVVESNPDCEQLRRAYYESQECFAPFMLVDGGIRVEAYQYCRPIADPSSECGAASELPQPSYR